MAKIKIKTIGNALRVDLGDYAPVMQSPFIVVPRRDISLLKTRDTNEEVLRVELKNSSINVWHLALQEDLQSKVKVFGVDSINDETPNDFNDLVDKVSNLML